MLLVCLLVVYICVSNDHNVLHVFLFIARFDCIFFVVFVSASYYSFSFRYSLVFCKLQSTEHEWEVVVILVFLLVKHEIITYYMSMNRRLIHSLLCVACALSVYFKSSVLIVVFIVEYIERYDKKKMSR